MIKKMTAWVVILVVALSLAACSQEAMPQETEEETVPADYTYPEVPVVVAETQPEPEPEPVARRIREGFSVFLNGIEINERMSDRNHYSKTRISPEDTLRLESEEPFSSLYLIWNEDPGTYTIHYDGGSVTCGQYGFLHEFVRLPEAVTHVDILLPGEYTRTLCDVEAYTAGSAPEDVQVWLPPYQEADILVFPTHSDDDALFFGALISYYAIERQLKVQTAFMVDHTGYSHRDHERLNGLWAMGIRHYPILGSAPDHITHDFNVAMRYYASSDILGWQIEQIRRFRPLVVVGHDLDGEYGNGGHKVNAHYLTYAIHVASDPEMYPESAEEYGVWQAAKLYLHLYPENEWYLDVNTPMENDPLGRTPFEAAEDGFAAHESQLQWGRVQQSDHNRAYDCRPFGLYFTLVGQDDEADVMDNIDPAWRRTH